jgi:hypothetical protein
VPDLPGDDAAPETSTEHGRIVAEPVAALLQSAPLDPSASTVEAHGRNLLRMFSRAEHTLCRFADQVHRLPDRFAIPGKPDLL